MQLREATIAFRNLIGGCNLISLPLLRRPNLAVKYVGECFFMKGCLDGEAMIPQRHVWEALGESGPVSVIIETKAAAEWFRRVASYTADLVSLCMLCQIIKPKIVFEIGTFHGAGTLHLACNANEAHVFTLDLSPGSPPALHTTVVDREHVKGSGNGHRMFFESGPQRSRITQLYGDSAEFDFTPWLRSVDLFFIDGAHSYEYVRNDTMKALECCHAGSTIAWHDYGRFGVNGVSRWLHEFREQRQIYRVPGGSLAYMTV